MSNSPIRRRNHRIVVACVAVLSAVLLASCSDASYSSSPVSVDSAVGGNAGGMSGDTLNPAVALDSAAQSAVFSSTSGSPTTLGDLQNGHLMLVYFGYTHCPDVCPTTMADVGIAMRELPSVEQAHIQVVFVTSDPDRDSPPVMKAWLSNFDNSLPLPFVGLTAKISQIDSVAKSLGIPLSPPVKQPNGTITVQHGAQTLAFVKDKAHLVWLADTTPGGYEHDLNRLVGSLQSA